MLMCVGGLGGQGWHVPASREPSQRLNTTAMKSGEKCIKMPADAEVRCDYKG